MGDDLLSVRLEMQELAIFTRVLVIAAWLTLSFNKFIIRIDDNLILKNAKLFIILWIILQNIKKILPAYVQQGSELPGADS